VAIWLSAIISARRWVGDRCGQNDHRRFREAELARGHDPAVAGDDHAIIADQHRVHEAELGDRSRDLRHLLIGMGAGIARVRDQSLERPSLDVLRKFQVHRDTRICLG
jgi:hypothetical protein